MDVNDSGNDNQNPGVIKIDNNGADSWRQLKDSIDSKVFAQAWVQTQAEIIGSAIKSGVVILGTPEQEAFKPYAVWPDRSAVTEQLISAIESVVNNQQQGSQIIEGKQTTCIACPVFVYQQFCGAFAFEVDAVPEQALNRIVSQLEWGAGWLETNIHRNKYTASDRLAIVLELIATSVYYEGFQAAATAVATELANVLNCERVAIGFLRGKHSQLRALSHSATFNKKTNMVRRIEAAMDEAIDQHTTTVFPPLKDSPVQVTRAHQALSSDHDTSSICTVPLTAEERLFGAITLERASDQPFDPATIKLCQHAASLIGPLLEMKDKDDRWIVRKVIDSAAQLLKKIFGARHFGLKLTFIILTSVVLFFTYTKGDYRITADARLEGTIQRSIAAPVAGYIVESNARAGDIVRQGSTLFTLDDKDLRLERLKWVSQKLKSTREFNEAIAEGNRARARVLSAQIEQAEAEIAVLDEQLARTVVKAPFDGFVVSGDLSQSLGSPVERGDTLFQVAPLDSYRVILETDERDIADVEVGQSGRLALTSMPDDILTVRIEKITPIATAEEGRNYFRVESVLEGESNELLRPGMEGVGKIYVGERKLIWIWTYKILHGIRMFFWSWWP